MSKIRNFEWGVLIGVALGFDIFQLVLDALGAGLFINPPLDLFAGFALQRYFKYRGVEANWKQWISWISAPLLEFFTASIFPLGWVIEVLVTMVIDKAEKKAGEIVGSIGPKEGEDTQNKHAA